jgi:hypothetical protein
MTKPAAVTSEFGKQKMSECSKCGGAGYVSTPLEWLADERGKPYGCYAINTFCDCATGRSIAARIEARLPSSDDPHWMLCEPGKVLNVSKEWPRRD